MRKIISTLLLVLAISSIAKAQSNRLKVDGGIQTDTISVKKINIANGSGSTVLLGDGNSATLGTGLSIANGVISASGGVANVTTTVDTTSLSNRVNKKLDASDTTKLKAYTDSKVAGIVIPSVTKSSLGLDNVNNTSDADKPISTATQTALDAKLDYSTYSSFQSGMLYVLNQKAFSYELTNGLAAKADTSALSLKATKAALTAGLALKADASALDAKLDAADTTKLKTYIDAKVAAIEVPSVTKSSLGLDNVNNTSDASKPISTATQAALDAKADTTALALKASKAALTAGLGAKADTASLALKANKSDLIAADERAQDEENSIKYTLSVFDERAKAAEAQINSALTAGLAAKADTSALALKATKAALTAGLAAKADTAALALKATKTALTAGLAAKADTSALSLKADKTALTLKADASALALKADASALAAKADTTALNAKADTAALALKANKIQNTLIVSTDNNTINLTSNHDMIFVKGTNDTLYLPNAANNAGKKIEMIFRSTGNNYVKVNGSNAIFTGNLYPSGGDLWATSSGLYSQIGTIAGTIYSDGYLRVLTGIIGYQGYQSFSHLVFNCDGTAWYLSFFNNR